MPNSAQQDSLNSYLADGGIYIQVVLEYRHVNVGTTLFYLERALEENCNKFLNSLDKLFKPHLEGKAKQDNLNFIQSLKLINDLFFNNDVKYGEFGSKPALEHYFGKLGVVNVAEFQVAIKLLIAQHIAKFHIQRSDELGLQIQNRIRAERYITPNTSWRIELDLPLAQLAPSGIIQRFYTSRICEVFLEVQSACIGGPSLSTLNNRLIADPDNIHARIQRAQIWSTRNDLKALEDYNYVLQFYPKNFKSLIGRAAIYERQGKLNLSLLDFQYALKVDPHSGAAIEGVERLSGQLRIENQDISDVSLSA